MVNNTDNTAKINAADPTPRTLEQIYREITQLEARFEIRFKSYDEAVKLLQEFANRQPTTEAVDRDLKAETELTAERFKSTEKLEVERLCSVKDRFKELDLRYDQLDGSNKEAISAALRAAEKAVEKTEINFTKQIDNLVQLISSTKGSLESNISDIKDRVTIMEANKAGSGQAWGVVLSVIFAAAAAAGVIGFIIARSA
jgi:hypothetical protein